MATILTAAVIYVLVEEYYFDTVPCTDIIGTYTTKEQASRAEKALQRKLDLSGQYHSARIIEMEVNNKITVPNHVKVYVGIDQSNLLAKPRLAGTVDKPIDLTFEPLKDNVHSYYNKGNFVLTIEADNKSVDEIVDEAFKKVEKNKGICPQWVLDSEDGHDPDHPQGNL